jgi:hypothetical protein
MEKHPIYPERVRKIPRQFSWVDHRLVQHHHIDRLSHTAAALYLFLVTVADARGLSYYSNESLTARLGMSDDMLAVSRETLAENGLVAYRKPLYQVLSLEAGLQTVTPFQRCGDIQSLGKILGRIGKGAS